MNHNKIEQAALNNALWCDTVCRSHGAPGEFLAGLWVNRHETPCFYPNVVTLEGGNGTTRQMAEIRRLVQADLPAGWAVKDSFGTLDLAPLGFRELLLADESVAIIAAHRGEQISAGAIANRTGEVVGLSNVFTPEKNAEAFWAGCLARAMVAFPALPLVGYERGEALDRAIALGFERIGPLRVWSRA